MVAGIPSVQSALNFFMNPSVICHRRFQTSKLGHTTSFYEIRTLTAMLTTASHWFLFSATRILQPQVP
jgi:hypothetical protein